MKFRLFTFVLLMTFLLLGCENELFRELTGVYEVKFDTNGGSPVEAVITSLIKTEPVTTRDGYYFIRWNDYQHEDSYLTVFFPFQPTSDLTLYAHWLSKPKVVLEEQNGELHCFSNLTYETLINDEKANRWYIYYGASPSTETMSLLTTENSSSVRGTHWLGDSTKFELTTDINPQEGYYYAVKLEVDTIIENYGDSFYTGSSLRNVYTLERISDFSNVVQIGSSSSSGSSSTSSPDTKQLETPTITFGGDGI